MLFYSTLHTVGHLIGTFRVFSEADTVDEINDVFKHNEFKSVKTYPELLFTTIPGITGILLMIIIFAMGVTAMQCVRHKYFRVFSIVHIIGFPLFILLIIAHGCGTWFNYGFPYGSVTVSISLLIYMVYFIRRSILK